jgi:hypothetical protein
MIFRLGGVIVRQFSGGGLLAASAELHNSASVTTGVMDQFILYREEVNTYLNTISEHNKLRGCDAR